ncbi:hypothetical protein KGA66_24255 [Actinocrinis puniceicyclus]|uniref:DUF3558 domain-containing protein n=1 Tax=Actinocrinis puniceicyclus TaxID=977794 RepID=A0A8J7WPC8_9ACTN|nr:hypothetical protein [Actinocrinis puniceicyclus]MBS2966181.1 hypothetical protein [Actinocrinis puniceicyclus]
MRVPVARGARVLSAAAAFVGALGAVGACSAGGGAQHPASSVSRAPAAPSAPGTLDPLSGPIEPASRLPKSCATILHDQDLTGAFGAPLVGDTSYGSYAPLPTIGRTGRVTCGYGISVDQHGNAGPPAVSVSVITYDMASRAVARVAAQVRDGVAKGASARQVLVDGHPASVLAQPAASGTASFPAAGASATASPPTAADTELVMADGNRTFVITIPVAKLSAADAASVLTNLAVLVYQRTLPPSASGPSVGSPGSR